MPKRQSCQVKIANLLFFWKKKCHFCCISMTIEECAQSKSKFLILLKVELLIFLSLIDARDSYVNNPILLTKPLTLEFPYIFSLAKSEGIGKKLLVCNSCRMNTKCMSVLTRISQTYSISFVIQNPQIKYNVVSRPNSLIPI